MRLLPVAVLSVIAMSVACTRSKDPPPAATSVPSAPALPPAPTALAHCDVRDSRGFCSEYPAEVPNLKVTCELNHGTYAPGVCSRVGAVGECKLEGERKVYYSQNPPAKADCEGELLHGTFVARP